MLIAYYSCPGAQLIIGTPYFNNDNKSFFRDLTCRLSRVALLLYMKFDAMTIAVAVSGVFMLVFDE